jgi:hypothetical protein
MSGTINLALTQQFDMDGAPLSGGLLQFFTAGTSTPQTPFQDTALTIAHSNPIVLDASGRVPMFYVSDGFIKIRLTDKNGVVIIAADQLLVIGPSSGGSTGGSTGDVTRQFDTGDIKARYDDKSINGWVRCNGNTIGNAGASEPNGNGESAKALYLYLYTFPSIKLADGAVKTGNALTDFGNNLKIVLPDLRGRTIAGLDDMGALLGAASRLTASYWGLVGVTPTTDAITLGHVGGDEKRALVGLNIAGHTHTITASGGSPAPGVGNFTSGRVTVYQGNTVDHTHAWGNYLGSPAQGVPSGVTSGPINAAADQAVSLDHTHSGVVVTSHPQGSLNNAGWFAGSGSTGNIDTLVDQTGTVGGSLNHYHAVGGQTGPMAGAFSGANTVDHRHTFSGTTDANQAAAPTPLATATPSMVMTIYIKL